MSVTRCGSHLLHRVVRPDALPAELLNGRVDRRSGRVARTWSVTFGDGYRVADDSLEQYELYVGEDAMPDFDGVGQPVDTSATLPFSWSPTPPVAGTTKLYCVTRKRNKYNMLSFNQHPVIVEIDTDGDEVLGPLSDPEILKVTDGAAGEIIIQARYPAGVDRDPADTWSLYVKAAADPVIGVDSAVATASFGLGLNDYFWRIAEDGLTPGTVYHCMVTVTRDGDGTGEYGASAVVQHTAADTYDLNGYYSALFGGTESRKGT